MMTQKNCFKFKFFAPNARLLTEDEIAQLPTEKTQAAKSSGADGLWLEIECPDKSCIDEDGRINISGEAAGARKSKGFLLNLFCPEDHCEIVEPSDAA